MAYCSRLSAQNIREALNLFCNEQYCFQEKPIPYLAALIIIKDNG
jgi:hypothetical protein